MTFRARIGSCLLVLVAFAGCASTKVSNRETLDTGKIARPNQIWVYDFVATPADLPADSSISAPEHSTPQTADQIATGRKVGAEIAVKLVDEIRAMGMSAARGSSGTTPAVNDVVIRGYLLSVDKGSAVERVAIGFGAGASELRVAVEGYQMTGHGLSKLGSGDVDAGGAKGPGVAVPAAVAIATANPIGLIVSSGVKLYGEASGSSEIEGRAAAVAKEIGAQLKTRFEKQGWID